ncbi:MAG: ATP-binding protein [Myxococcales bacterium]|nr:ATP-binding protein [Myxococcales bacterium]
MSGPDDIVAKRWADRIGEILENRHEAFEAAWELRTNLLETFSWQAAAAAVLERVRSLLPGSGPPSDSTPPPGSTEEADVSDAKAKLASSHPATRAFAQVSQAVVGWPATLPGGRWLEREELAAIRGLVEANKTSNTVVLGVPGSGKSALFARLATDLAKSDLTVLAIRADLLPRPVEQQADLQSWMGLNTRPSKAVKALATLKGVVVLIDQLDSLCDIVDVSTQRLSVLLEFVEEIADAPNVHVILSCRRFEYNHDVRLRRLQANEVQLSLPEVDDVALALKDRGYAADTWSPKFLESLRVPQHLRMFLELSSPDRVGEAFRTYQQMLEELWRRRLRTDGERKVALIDSIVERMAKEEVLSLPLAYCDTAIDVAEVLVAEGILRIEGSRIGFRHQTLYEFARARSFVREGASLVEIIRNHQQSLFVRSSLWSTLAFLRVASPERYEGEVSGVWAMEDLRPHLRALLIDFLGQLSAPSPLEVALLTSCLDHDAKRGSALAAIRLNAAVWFPLLNDGWVTELMSGGARWQFAAVLRSAIEQHRKRVLDAISEHWLCDPGNHDHVFQVLAGLKTWNEHAAEMIKTVSSADRERRLYTGVILTRMCEHSEALAIDVVAARLRDELARARETTRTDEPPDEFGLREGKEYERVLHSLESFTGLSELPKSQPVLLRDALFPIYAEIADELATLRHHHELTYRDDHSLELELELEGGCHERDGVVSLLRRATQQSAKRDRAEVKTFLQQAQERDTVAVHRLVTSVLLEFAEYEPEVPLEYLLGDPRRLAVGDHHGRDRYTRRLVRALSVYLSPDQLLSLEEAIKTSRIYPDQKEETQDVKLRRLYWESNLRHRLRLLSEIPTDLASEATRKEVRDARSQGGTFEDESFTTGVHHIGSPVSAEQMKRASDDDLLHLFEVLHDGTGWSHPKRFMEGGSVQAAREFGALATKDPERAIKLMRQLDPGKQERPVGEALRSLAKLEAQKPAIERLVLDCAERGFSSEEFKGDAAWALIDVAQDGLTDETCALLESWLQPCPSTGAAQAAAPPSNEKRTQDGERDQPVIWGMGMGGALPHGNYPTLYAIFLGLMARTPPASSTWSASLTRHLAREESPDVWRAMTRHLRFIPHAEPEAAGAFLSELFEKYPTVLASNSGARLMAHTHTWATDAHYDGWLECLLESDWGQGERAFGELLMLRAARAPEGEARERVSRAVSGECSHDARAGIARTAKELWSGKRERDFCTVVLTELVPVADLKVGRVLMDILGGPQAWVPDSSLVRLAEALAARPDILVLRSLNLFERLADLLPLHAKIVLNILEALMGQLEASGQSLYQAGYGHSVAKLISLVMTLQRLKGHRERSLDLFEKLLGQDLDAVGQVLVELDARPTRVGPSM